MSVGLPITDRQQWNEMRVSTDDAMSLTGSDSVTRSDRVDNS